MSFYIVQSAAPVTLLGVESDADFCERLRQAIADLPENHSLFVVEGTVGAFTEGNRSVKFGPFEHVLKESEKVTEVLTGKGKKNAK